MDSTSIAELVRAARKGDETAFARLVKCYERQLVAHFLGQTPSVTDAEELAHDTFVRAYMALSRLKDPAQFGSWVFGIARNVYREWSKDRRRQADVPPPAWGERTEVLKRKAVLHREIFTIVAALPDPYREVLSLRYFSQTPCAEIARLLGRPVGTVTKQISRGHAMVAESLQRLRGFTTLLSFWLPKKEENRGA